MSEEIVSDLMRAHVYRLASTGQRVDGRALDEPRKLSLERTYVKTAEGSARAGSCRCLGWASLGP